MRLDQLLKHFSYESVQGSHDLIITDICYHSGKVKRGSLFVCIKGQYTDGHDYIMDAVKAGAFAVVVDESCMVNVRWECFIYTEHGKVRVHELVRNYGMAVIGVKDTRQALAQISAAFYDYRDHRNKRKDDDGVSYGRNFKRSGIQDRHGRYDMDI